MRKVVSAVLFAATTLVLSNAAEAEGPRAVTTWSFHVSYSSGQYSDSSDPTESVSVLMYTGASWRCTREPVSLTNDGMVLGGFACRQPGGSGQVFITAACTATSEAVDHAEATISDSTTKAFMRLSTSCVTRMPTRGASTKPAAAIENDL